MTKTCWFTIRTTPCGQWPRAGLRWVRSTCPHQTELENVA